MNKTLPNNWRFETLGQCCSIVSGATPRRDVPEYWDDHIPWVTPKDISSLEGPVLEDAPEYISREGYKNCSATLLPKGSVLFSSRAPIGLVALTGREMCTNQGFKSLVPGGSIHSAYLYHCMKWMAPKIAELGNGATFKEVSKEVISRVEIPLPPLAEQKRIAAILDKADAIRRKRQAAIKLADDFLRATFLDMFGDPVSNPKGWEVKHLGGLCERLHQGVNTAADKVEYMEKGFPIIQSRNFTNGQLDFNGVKFVSGDDFKKYRDKYAPKKGDLLFSNIGTVGATMVVNDNKDFLIAWNVFLFVLRKNIVTQDYVNFYLKSLESQKFFDQFLTGGTVKFINKKTISSLQIPLPKYENQKKFSRVVSCANETIIKIKKSVKDAEQLFNSFAQHAFRGEL